LAKVLGFSQALDLGCDGENAEHLMRRPWTGPDGRNGPRRMAERAKWSHSFLRDFAAWRLAGPMPDHRDMPRFRHDWL